MPTIPLEEFQRIELRTCRVVAAERLTQKLLKLEVDLGDERRTIVAGGGEYYEPSWFVGKTFIIVANLQSKRIRGVLSQGMLLAADVGGKPIWLTTFEEVPPGTRVY